MLTIGSLKEKLDKAIADGIPLNTPIATIEDDYYTPWSLDDVEFEYDYLNTYHNDGTQVLYLDANKNPLSYRNNDNRVDVNFGKTLLAILVVKD